MKNKLKYNVHKAINNRSHRKGLVNDRSLNYVMLCVQFNPSNLYSSAMAFNLESCKYPTNKYGIFYPNQYGKTHSKYNNF